MEQLFFDDVSPIQNVDFPASHVSLLVCFCLQTRIHPWDSKFMCIMDLQAILQQLKSKETQKRKTLEAENGGPPEKGDESDFGNHLFGFELSVFLSGGY